jgi:hypothetical protein
MVQVTANSYAHLLRKQVFYFAQGSLWLIDPEEPRGRGKEGNPRQPKRDEGFDEGDMKAEVSKTARNIKETMETFNSCRPPIPKPAFIG